MKKLALVIVSVIMFSCGGSTVEKPERLLSEDEMTNIIYDITMIQAFRSVKPEVLDYNNIKGQEYIFKKYKIDSLTFAQNNAWYTANMDKYEAIQKKVTERIKKERKLFSQKNDTLSNPSKSGSRSKRDSLKKAALNKVKSNGTQK